MGLRRLILQFLLLSDESVPNPTTSPPPRHTIRPHTWQKARLEPDEGVQTKPYRRPGQDRLLGILYTTDPQPRPWLQGRSSGNSFGLASSPFQSSTSTCLHPIGCMG